MLSHPVNTILVVGQAAPAKAAPRPYDRTRLYRWFADAGIDVDLLTLKFSSVLETFPGSRTSGEHIAPTSAQERSAQARLETQVRFEGPIAIIVVGMSAARSLGLQGCLDDLVGRLLTCFATPAVVLPHPSGRNCWPYSSQARAAALSSGLEELREIITCGGIGR